LLLLGVNIGAGVSELTALTVCDVWQHSKVVLVLTLCKETIKGKRELYSIPPNLTAKAVISELIAWIQAEGESISPSAYLFASPLLLESGSSASNSEESIPESLPHRQSDSAFDAQNGCQRSVFCDQ